MKTVLTVTTILLIAVTTRAGFSMEHEAEIDILFAEYTGGVPGAAVMVIKSGEAVFEKGYGLAELEMKTPVTVNTNFRLASVTKQFTAMCIMQLIERGTLTFKSTLCDIYPDFPEYGRAITVHHLLQHSSGLIDYESLIPEDAVLQVHDSDVLTMMAGEDSTYFIPGTKFRYSNSGYAVLAMIVEKISRRGFGEYLSMNIFQPLGMHNSVAFVDGVTAIRNRAFGYAGEDDAFIFSDQSLTSAVLGDGGIYTSVEDLFRWDQTLYTDRLVSRKLIEKAFTPGILQDGSPLEYGYGWFIDELEGHRRIYHGGETCGFSTAIHRYPGDRLTVIVLANRRGADVKMPAEKIAELFFK